MAQGSINLSKSPSLHQQRTGLWDTVP